MATRRELVLETARALRSIDVTDDAAFDPPHPKFARKALVVLSTIEPLIRADERKRLRTVGTVLIPCRHCGDPATVRVELTRGCVVFREDTEQYLCEVHLGSIEPLGPIISITDLW